MHPRFPARRRIDDAAEGVPVLGHEGLPGVLAKRVRDAASLGLKQTGFRAAQAGLLAGSITVGVEISRADEWHPFLLVALLFLLALGGHWLSVTIRIGVLSASMVALVLAMSLLGPDPAMAFGISAMVLTSALRRLPPAQWLTNLSTFAVVPLAGGLMIRWLAGDVHDPSDAALTRSVTFGLIVMAMFIATVVLNFVLVALEGYVDGGHSLRRQARELFFPLLPGQLATGCLATILAVAYTNAGVPVLVASVAALVIFQHLTVALLRSEDRADQLEARTIHLVSLQLGVLRTLVRALAMRDETTGRHSAAVALYARELAKEMDASEEEQETVHTAGLLHDIGKFTWPDRVLRADVVSPGDQEIVRRHPQDGAELVGALDGYGPVADAILYHHERVDGSGYPAGLIGREIPLSSRMLAICCVYDTMTKRNSYRAPISPREGMAELRVGADRGQLDPELVERFIAMLDRDGARFAERDEADFDTELAFERRVREMARGAGQHV